jgi:hypothetical protein
VMMISREDRDGVGRRLDGAAARPAAGKPRA